MIAMKVRYKGWRKALEEVQQGIDLLIAGTPTSELRNKLTDINIKLIELQAFDKVQKEVA